MRRLPHLVRAYVPHSMTGVEEPGFHLEDDHAICPHCEEIYCTIGISDMCIELDCCPNEDCKSAALIEMKSAAQALVEPAQKWRKAEPTLRCLANLQPFTDELMQQVVVSNLRNAARNVLGWCIKCQAREAAGGVCRECAAIGNAEGFNG